MINKVFYDHCVNQHAWGQFPCTNENCKFVSYSQFCLKGHTRMHTTESIARKITHTCTRKNCEKKFGCMAKLELHLKIHDNDVIKCFYCQWAGTEFKEYSIHMNTHFRIKTQKCQLCPRAFYTATALTKHLETMHERSTDKYSCENCDFKTYSADLFYYHKRINCK